MKPSFESASSAELQSKKGMRLLVENYQLVVAVCISVRGIADVAKIYDRSVALFGAYCRSSLCGPGHGADPIRK